MTNQYTVRYYRGTTRYQRSYYTGKVKAENMTQAVEKAEAAAKRQRLEVAAVTRVFED